MPECLIKWLIRLKNKLYFFSIMTLKKISLIILFLILSACGYHLRGDVVLPDGLESIYMDGASGVLQQEMKKNLSASSNVTLADSASNAGIIIKFANEEMKSQIVSISTGGRANQFQLIYQLAFSIYQAPDKLLLADQNINIKRDYFNDQTDILGKSNEENVIRTEMYQQAVNSIINRTGLAMKNKQKAK